MTLCACATIPTAPCIGDRPFAMGGGVGGDAMRAGVDSR